MTESEAVRKLEGLRGDDPEKAHGLADDVLVEYARANGGQRVASAWEDAAERIGFWYA